MANEERSLHFTALGDDEKGTKLKRAASDRTFIVLWEKGSSKKENYQLSSYDQKAGKFFLDASGSESTSLSGRQVLFSFSHKGLSFFGQGRFVKQSSLFTIEIQKEIYKCERRIDYRLLAYPHLDVNVRLSVKDEYQGQSSKIIPLKGKTPSETQLFRNFLRMTGQQNLTGEITSEIRVHDISVSGFSIIVGEMEKDFFKKGEEFGDMEMIFEGAVIHIPLSTVVYCIDSVEPVRGGGKRYKVGLTIEGITESEEKLLREKINSKIGKSEDEKKFEDFLK